MQRCAYKKGGLQSAQSGRRQDAVATIPVSRLRDPAHGQPQVRLSRKVRAAELYFDGEMSYRAVGRELDVAPLTAFRCVDALGAAAKSFVEIAEELKPRWGGWLYADGKAVYIPAHRRRWAASRRKYHSVLHHADL